MGSTRRDELIYRFVELGDSFSEEGRYKEASESYLKAFNASDGEIVDILIRMVTSLIGAGRTDKAEEVLLKCWKRKRDEKTVLSLLSSVYSTTGEHKKRIEVLKRALSLRKDDIKNRTQLALCYIETGQKKEAGKQLKKATRKVKKKRGEDLALIAEQYLELGDGDKALSVLGKANIYTKKDALFYQVRARTRRVRGDMKGALEDIDRCMEMADHSEGAMKERARILMELGKHKEAIDQLRTYLKIYPGDEEAITLLDIVPK